MYVVWMGVQERCGLMAGTRTPVKGIKASQGLELGLETCGWGLVCF